MQFVEQNYKLTSWRSNSTLCVNMCEFVIGASGYYEITSEMVAKKAQAVNLEKELQAAKKELEAAAEKDERPGGISATSIKAVIKGALEGGVLVLSVLDLNGVEPANKRLVVLSFFGS